MLLIEISVMLPVELSKIIHCSKTVVCFFLRALKRKRDEPTEQLDIVERLNLRQSEREQKKQERKRRKLEVNLDNVFFPANFGIEVQQKMYFSVPKIAFFRWFRV